MKTPVPAVPVELSLPEEEVSFLDGLAAAEGMTREEMVRLAIEQFRKAREAQAGMPGGARNQEAGCESTEPES